MLHCQDVRDLVELTVDRMDVYHLVPLCMCCFFWCSISLYSIQAFTSCSQVYYLALLLASFLIFLFFLGRVDCDCAVALMTSDIHIVRWERFSWNFALCSFVKAECRLGHVHTQMFFW